MITVGISDLNVARAPDVLVTYALGSCVGICLYDSFTRVAGLSHIMLPSSALSRDKSQPARYADTAIPMLIQRMVAAGANKSRLRAKIAGGAKMFATVSDNSLSNIGQRNVAAAKETLRAYGIPILADDTGKDYGRTLYFNAADGSMRIKSAKHGEWVF